MKPFVPRMLFVVLILTGIMCSTEIQVEYPETKTIDVVDDYHGTKVADPFRWLEDTDSGETAAWVAAQNDITFGYLERIPAREKLRNRLTELWDYPKQGAPSKEGDWYFFSRNEGLQNQSVWYRQRSLDGKPELVIDPNSLSEDGTVALTMFEVSKNGRYLAYGTAASGSDWQEFHVRDLETGEDLADRLQWIKFSGASWAKNNSGFYYSRYPEPAGGEKMSAANRNQTVYYHKIGDSQQADRLIYELPQNPDWGFDVRVSEDGGFLVMSVWDGTDPRNRVHYLPLRNGLPSGRAVRLLDDFDAMYSFITNDGNTFYFLTNKDASRNRIVAIDINRPGLRNWKEIVPESANVLESVTVANGMFVCSYLEDAKNTLKIYTKAGFLDGDISLPALGAVTGISGKPEETELFYSFTSFTYPATVYRYDFQTGSSDVLFAPDVSFDPEGYETTQVFYTSRDGARIPMFIVMKKGLELNGKNPALLYGYGGFNISLTPSFDVSNLLWLEMGGVYAMPNLRGGGEYGEEWHQQGILDRKQNVFDDFIAAAEFLVDKQYTSSDKLAIQGGSNGGLLVGACMTQRPDLFEVALPAVGVMDMLRYHKFTIGWAWASDYGSSDYPEQFEYLYEYSPLHNLADGTDYPATLVTTADHDDRVVPGHSFKFAARLQQAHAGDDPVLIRIETKAGHGAGKPTTKQIEEAADLLAFTLQNLGMKY